MTLFSVIYLHLVNSVDVDFNIIELNTAMINIKVRYLLYSRRATRYKAFEDLKHLQTYSCILACLNA